MLSDDARKEVLDLIEGAKGDMLHEFTAVKRNQATLKGDIAQAHHDINLVHDDVQYLREQMRDGFLEIATSMRSLVDDNRATRVEVDMLSDRMGRLEVRQDAVESRLVGLEAKVDGLGVRMVGVESRLVGLEAKVDGLDVRMAAIETRMDRADGRFDGLDSRLDGVDSRLKGLGAQLGEIAGAVNLVIERLDQLRPPEA